MSLKQVTPVSITAVTGGVGRFVNGAGGSNAGQKWEYRSSLRTKGEGSVPIEVTNRGVQITYKIEGGLLKVRNVTPRGTWVGTFEKIQ